MTKYQLRDDKLNKVTQFNTRIIQPKLRLVSNCNFSSISDTLTQCITKVLQQIEIQKSDAVCIPSASHSIKLRNQKSTQFKSKNTSKQIYKMEAYYAAIPKRQESTLLHNQKGSAGV